MVEEAIKGQLGLAEMGRELKRCLRTAKSLMKSKESATVLSATRETRDTIMDYAKLTGQLVEKREVKTMTAEQTSAIRDLVQRSLTPRVASSILPGLSQPATTPATSEHEAVAASEPATETN